MGLPKVFKRKEQTPQQPVRIASEGPIQSSQNPCRHLALAARWGKAHDVGADLRHALFRCTDCGMEFSIEDAHEVGRRHLVTW